MPTMDPRFNTNIPKPNLKLFAYPRRCRRRISSYIPTRGSIDSYQVWANDVGDESYTFENLTPYFQRLAYFTPPDTRRDSRISHLWSDAVASWFKNGFAAVGISASHDEFSSGYLKGSNSNRILVSDQLPAPSHRYYDLASIHAHHGQRMLFSSDKPATGVQVKQGDHYYTLSATKEAILSAGALRSPKLLMLSGLGPTQILSGLCGLGQNTWDYIPFGTTDLVTRNLVLARHVRRRGRAGGDGDTASPCELYVYGRDGGGYRSLAVVDSRAGVYGVRRLGVRGCERICAVAAWFIRQALCMRRRERLQAISSVGDDVRV
ncbi:choline dehydrogenase [Drepanopeziza brunnea f. sp. 'multigermtubi' MB_m1]|uniref:Choline dehydrogenase n=1 Tax=Marssonina brunnea f. sp. multigermtubi (strain MB_m1) TaxID=1072389 RepID=K1X4T0_MARBU|nr:choline dehydrogenase [Drepanopeziza brunnea f. sp. 'multigermtubi' MB_m1]EKD20166.1 choline dehydrogenase [Drepanopeziza brunnea f. sp. 'multigermtubi' MB_m1]